jgi:hypothetical protein
MTSIFYLKFGDTLPILKVTLLNPDGTPADLTGTTGWKLHVRKPDGSVVIRDMAIDGAPTLGIVKYIWTVADWDVLNVNGYLAAGPALPLKQGEREHEMEYKVLSGTSRLTFPNTGYDTLRISRDIS